MLLTRFARRRYKDNGLQFSFGSAEFSSLSLHPSGTFEFKNGYKMEFSSARQFKEQSEGLFDDLTGTYDIVWGEYRRLPGKNLERRLVIAPSYSQQHILLKAEPVPRRPTMENKRRSSRMLLGSIGGAMSGTLKKMAR